MLQALLHKKLKDSFNDPTFRPSEDTLTSSVIGLLQYLPSDLIASIFRESCGRSSSFPTDLGDVTDIRFWDHLDGKNTTNSRLVEPDVLLVTEHYNIIIEVKKDDEARQYRGQWQNEIQSFLDTYPDERRKVVLLALGGNESMKEMQIRIGMEAVTVYRASLFNLLHAVSKELTNQHPNHIRRLLRDVINAFELHRFFDIEWMDSLTRYPLGKRAVCVFADAGTFGRLYRPAKQLNTKLTRIWQI